MTDRWPWLTDDIAAIETEAIATERARITREVEAEFRKAPGYRQGLLYDEIEDAWGIGLNPVLAIVNGEAS